MIEGRRHSVFWFPLPVSAVWSYLRSGLRLALPITS